MHMTSGRRVARETSGCSISKAQSCPYSGPRGTQQDRPFGSALPGKGCLTLISSSDVSTLKGRMLSSSLADGFDPGPHHPSSSGKVSSLSRETNQ